MARIVVVDDSLYMRSILKHLLVKGGHTVVGEADSYETAMAAINARQPDLLTLDIILKENTGLDVLREVKREYPHLHVIMVSAVGEDFIVEEALELGAMDYIVKPFSEEKVLATVQRVSAMSH